MLASFDQNRVESGLEEMTDPAVLTVETQGVDAVQVPHTSREIGLWGLYEQVIVVAEQAVSEHEPAKARDGLVERRHPLTPVTVVEEDPCSRVPTRRHVVYAAWKVESEWPSHAAQARSDRCQRGQMSHS